MAFSFGSAATTKAITGTQAGSSFGSGFGGFGTATTTSTVTGFGGFGAFGAKTTTAGSTGFGFGSATAASNASTGFGTGGFSFGAPKSTASSFGTFGTSTLGGTTSTGATGIGTTTFGQPQQSQQQSAAQQLANMATAVSLPVIFGDERDALLAKWNQLQAYWGVGKGYFSQSGAVDFTPENPFCRFKAVGYSCLPKRKDEDGLVLLTFNKKAEDVQKNQSQVVQTLHKILGANPNVSVCVEGVKPQPDSKSVMTMYIQERSPTGTVKRYKATDVAAHMSSAAIKSQLTAQLTITDIVPQTGLNNDQLKSYLETPPAGIDPLLWQQAKLDNPDPEKLIPVPMIGFSELHKRLKHQQQQTKMHQSRLDVITGDIGDLQRNQTNMMTKLEQYKRKHLELSHRTLRVIVQQEIYRKLGYAIQADEEQLRVQLETIQAELSAPTQFKGRLNELMSQMRLQSQFGTSRGDLGYQIDTTVQHEIKQHLKTQQEGLNHLINVIKDDLQDLQLIGQGLVDSSQIRR